MTGQGPSGHSPKRGDGMRLRLALKGEAAAPGLHFGAGDILAGEFWS